MVFARKFLGIGFGIIIIVASSFGYTAKNQTYETWGMYQGNAQHTGYVPIDINSKYIKKIWESKIGNGPSPLGKADNIYQASIGNKYIFVARNQYENSNILQAFSMENGQVIWEKEFGEHQIQAPAFDEGAVYVQTIHRYGRQSKLRAYDSETGSELYSKNQDDDLSRCLYVAPVIHDGYIYAGEGFYSGITKRNKLNGDYIWQNLTGSSKRHITVAINDKYLIYHSFRYLYSFDKSNGLVELRILDPNGLYTDTAPIPRLDDSKYAFLTEGQYLTKFNLESRSIEYVVHGVTSEPTIDDNYVYVIKDGNLTALDKITGEVSWITEYKKYGGSWYSQLPNIVATKNLVFVSDSNGTVAYSKIGNHDPAWEIEEGGFISLSTKGIFIVTHSEKGKLIAYSIDS